MVKKTIAEYLIMLFLSRLGIGFCVATYATFLLDHHLTLFQIHLVNAVFFGVMMLSEIPTGMFADMYGRKRSVMCSFFFFTIGLFWYGMSDTMSEFMIAESFIALGVTFSNGALQAWFVDTMKELGFRNDDDTPNMPTWLFGVEYTVMNICGIAAGFVGGMLADQHSAYPWFAGAGTMFLGALAVFFMMKEQRQGNARHNARESFYLVKERFVSGWHHVRTNSVLKFLFIVGMVNMFVLQVPNMQWQPFFTPLFSTNTSRGLLFTGMMIFLVAGSVVSMFVSKKIVNHRTVILYSQLSYGVCIACVPISAVIFGSYGMIMAVGVFLLHEIGRGFWIPVRDCYMHHAIPSSQRATLVSVTSVFQHAGGLCGLVLFGFFSDIFSMHIVWMSVGSILAMNSIVLLLRPRV